MMCISHFQSQCRPQIGGEVELSSLTLEVHDEVVREETSTVLADFPLLVARAGQKGYGMARKQEDLRLSTGPYVFLPAVSLDETTAASHREA